MKYGDAIKCFIKKLLLSQVEFAEKMDVAFVTVNRSENVNNVPIFKSKRKLAPLFNENGIGVDE